MLTHEQILNYILARSQVSRSLPGGADRYDEYSIPLSTPGHRLLIEAKLISCKEGEHKYDVRKMTSVVYADPIPGKMTVLVTKE